MREGIRSSRKDNSFRNLMLWAGGTLFVAIIAFIITFAVYNSKVKNEARVSTLNSRKIGELVPSIEPDMRS